MKNTLLLLLLFVTCSKAFSQGPLNALHFDGTNDYVSCPLPALFTNIAANDFTFEAWMNREGVGRVFYAQYDASNMATVLLSGANMLFYVRVSNVTYSVSVPIPAASQWCHIAFTWDASAQLPLIYVNGILQSGFVGGSSSTGTSNVMTIGSRTDGQQLYQGQMDEVRIWNTVRTACEIRAMMHSLPTGSEANLITYYNFNRGTGGGTNTAFTILPDQAGLNGGTLNNFALTGTISNWLVSTAPVTATGPQPVFTTTAAAVICPGASYAFGTQTLTTSGTYQELFVSAEGCDSLVTLNLTVDTLQTFLPPVTACSAYTWANTGIEYTASGQYSDTLVSINGCDSIVTLDLTIALPSAATQTVFACSAYSWPQTGATYTASGIYTDTIANAAGCDSIIQLDLTIALPTTSAQTATACTVYTWPQTGATYTASGVYTDTITNAAGCDSIIQLNLTVNLPTTSTQTVFACSAYSWAQTGATYTASGMYTDTMTNVAGCDSIIQLNLTIAQPTTSTQTAAACEAYTWPQTGATYTASGVYADTITNAAGCDSIVQLDLTVYEAYLEQQAVSHCGPFTWPVNGLTYAIPGFYTQTFQSIHGCDSVFTLSLFLSSPPVAEVTHDGSGTLANDDSDVMVLAWIDCSTGLAIPGEQGDVFTPAQNGSYAVVVYEGFTGCSDTSACFDVDFVGIEQLSAVTLNVWPNPSEDRVTIAFSGQEGQLSVYNAQGQLVLEQAIANGGELSLEALHPGVYFFDLKTGGRRGVERVVKR